MNSQNNNFWVGQEDKEGRSLSSGVLESRIALLSKLFLSTGVVVTFGILPLAQGIRILVGDLHQGNFVVFDDCGYLDYFSTANALVLIILGSTNLGLAFLAALWRSLKPVLIGFLIAIFVSIFVTFGGCLHG